MFGAPSNTPFGSSGGGGFGQANTAPAFGAPAPAAFGAPAPAPGGFGGGFGTPAPAPAGFGGGFGAPAPAPSTGFGGGFGTPAPAPAFGGGGFGAPPATSTPFGAPAAPAPTGGLFGSAPAPAPTGGLFGSAPAAPPATGFGTTSTFGGGAGGGGFGATANTTPAFGGGSTFGAPAPAPTGLFGAPAPAPATAGFGGFGSTSSAFGAPAPAPTGMFGAPAPPPAGGMFGAAPPAGGAGGGTKVQPYQATNRQDGNSNINFQAITAMAAYQTKSFEELRFEDYSQGNRGGGGAAPAAGFSGFGSPAPAPAPSTGLFGAPAPAPSGFGAPAPAPAFGAFGTPAPAPSTGLFGAPAPATGGFGAPAPAPGLFGAPAPAAGFGAPAFGAKPPGTGLFGGTPAPAPAFGAPAPTPGLFGAPAPATAFGAPAPTPGLFGAPAPATAFGAPAPATAFGAPAPAPYGAFGSPPPAPGTSLFGAPAPATGFGAPAPSLFGAPAPAAGGGLFGTPKPAGGGLFGAPAPAAPAAFGTPAPAGGIFGAPAPLSVLPAAPPVGSVMPPATDQILISQMTALENKRKELEKSDNFRRKTTDKSLVIGATLSEREGLSASLAPVRASYSPYRASPKSSARMRPRGFASPDKTPTPSLSRLGAGGRPMAAPDAIAASSATRLIINPSPKPKLKLALQANSTSAPSPLKITLPENAAAKTGVSSLSRGAPPTTPSPESAQRGVNTPNSADRGYEYYQQSIESPLAKTNGDTSSVPILTKEDYKCSPSIEEMKAMPAADLAALTNFSVERPGVGKVEWEGAVDVRNTNLDEVVEIESKSVSVYSLAEAENNKPAPGTKLNRPAILTLEGVFPPENTEESAAKMAKKVGRSTARMGADLIDYDPSTGIWVLRVAHFSRYALDDDSESESEAEPTSNTKVHFESGEREGRSRAAEEGKVFQRQSTPYKPRGFLGGLESDDDEMNLVSDEEMVDADTVSRQAESAFAAIKKAVTQQTKAARMRQVETAPFPEESDSSGKDSPKSAYIPSADDLAAAASGRGICGALRRKAGVKSSSTDFGIRMGKSFRVGWSPDGSFIQIKPGGLMVRGRPVFKESSTKGTNLKFLEGHRSSALKVSNGPRDCPQFTLPTTTTDLHSALNTYEKADASFANQQSIEGESFSLLKCLISRKSANSDALAFLGGSAVDDSTEESRRLFAVQQWLMKSCAIEVANEIQGAKLRNQKYDAILAAVSGGNLDHACSLADELGFDHLALLLASGPEGRPDLLKEVLQWAEGGNSGKIPDSLLRTYYLLGGQFRMEEDRFKQRMSNFDWRRFLAMKLSYDSSSNRATLASLIADYDVKATNGSAPYPQPIYASGSVTTPSTQCVRYRLMGLAATQKKQKLLSIIDPSGYTKSPHDFALAFHLSAIITAMGGVIPLSTSECENLIDGYVAQLISEGSWHWAVYVCLCQLNPIDTQVSNWKIQKAKSIVLQCFQEELLSQRNLLEGAGIPSGWFEEALALRCATTGDELGYLNHMARVDPDEARAFLEASFISNMLFMDKETLSHARDLLSVFALEEKSLANAIFEFFIVYEDVLKLEKENASKEIIDQAVPELLESCAAIEEIFASHQSGEAKLKGPTLRMVSSSKTVPMTCFLAEALSQTSLLKLQLRALKSGMKKATTATQVFNLSSSIDLEQDSGIAARENILRWLM